MVLEYQDPPNKWLLDGIATKKAVSDAQLGKNRWSDSNGYGSK